MKTQTALLLIYYSYQSFVSAFSPHRPPSVKGWPLYAETLEGWKIKGEVKPLNNFILVKLDSLQEKSDSGILFSKTVRPNQYAFI